MANEDFRQEVMSNKSSALVVLNTLSVKEGEILNIRYTTDSGSIDSLVAVGIKDGVGPDCYTMVSDQSIPLVNSITDVRPDVSDMISGTIYLFHDTLEEKYQLLFLSGSSIIEKDLTEDFYFTNIEDGKYYFFDSDKQKLVDVSANLSSGGGAEPEVDDDVVEFIIENPSTLRNVLFFKIEWIEDLKIDGEPIDTTGKTGKYYRVLSEGKHVVHFRVSEENQNQRGLLGWADDDSTGSYSYVTEITIPKSWTKTPSNCFEERRHLKRVTLPDTITTIGACSFQNLPLLEEINIPGSVTEIQWQAFNQCPSLKMLKFGLGGEDVSLAQGAISNCSSLECLEIYDCPLRFTGSTTPFVNLPKLGTLIMHMTAEPIFTPASPFGSIGSEATVKKLYRPEGVGFYSTGHWSTQLQNTLGFTAENL